MPNQHVQPEMNRQEVEYLSRLYQSQYMVVTNSIGDAAADLQELNSTARSLDRMDQISGKNALYGVGPDTYISCNIDKSGEIIIGIGAGYMIETSSAHAKEILASRIEKQNKMLGRLSKAKQELESAITGLSEMMKG